MYDLQRWKLSITRKWSLTCLAVFHLLSIIGALFGCFSINMFSFEKSWNAIYDLNCLLFIACSNLVKKKLHDCFIIPVVPRYKRYSFERNLLWLIVRPLITRFIYENGSYKGSFLLCIFLNLMRRLNMYKCLISFMYKNSHGRLNIQNKNNLLYSINKNQSSHDKSKVMVYRRLSVIRYFVTCVIILQIYST